MNEEILGNIWNQLSENGVTESDFDTWKSNFENDEQVQGNVYSYLKDIGATNSSKTSWKKNVGIAAIKKQKTKEDQTQEDATVKEDNTASTSEDGLSE